MKRLFKAITFFYVLFPLVVVPYIAHRTGNWYYLFGIVCYYLGLFLVAVNQKIIFMIPVIFCGWFWFTYGFSIHDFVFFLFLCMGAGAVFYLVTDNAKRFVNRTIPENKEASAYDQKVAMMNEKLEAYKQQNPTVKITPEIIDGIRNEVFFK